MKNLTKNLMSAVLVVAVALPAASFAAGPSRAGSGSGSTSNTRNTNTNTSTSVSRSNASRNTTVTQRTNQSTARTNSSSKTTPRNKDLRLTPSVLRNMVRLGLPIPDGADMTYVNNAARTNTNTSRTDTNTNTSSTDDSDRTSARDADNQFNDSQETVTNVIPPREALPLSREEFVVGLYRNMLDRSPDNAGLNFWLGHAYQGDESVEHLYRAFVESIEYKNKRESDRMFVTRLYRAMLFREPDTEGLNFWTNDLASGRKSRQDMVTAFLVSDEFRTEVKPRLSQLTAPAPITRNPLPRTNEVFVTDLYRTVLDREPDARGLNFWVQNAGTGEAGVQHLYTAFFVSQEYLNKQESNAAFVNRLYFSMLYRPIDPQGHAFWTAELDSGRKTRDDMLQAFFQSIEFKTEIVPQIAPLLQ